MGFARMMSTPVGRVVRGAAGFGVALTGMVAGGWFYLLGILGAMVFAMAWLNICLIGPILGAKFDWARSNPRTELGGPNRRRTSRARVAARR